MRAGKRSIIADFAKHTTPGLKTIGIYFAEMLSKSQLMQMIVGLAEVCDADLLDDDAMLNDQVCHASQRQLVRQARDTVLILRKDYDFTLSQSYESLAEGKTPSYVSMLHKRWSTAEKRKEAIHAFDAALVRLLSDDGALRLVRKDQTRVLEQLRTTLRSLNNPDAGRSQ